MYFDDGASLNALRYDNWKVTFKILEGNIFNGKRVEPNFPFIVNLRQDPFERYPTESMQYLALVRDEVLGVRVRRTLVIGQFLQSFKDFPPPAKKTGTWRHRKGPGNDPGPCQRRREVKS